MLSKTFKLLVLIGFLFLRIKSYAQPAFTIQNIKVIVKDRTKVHLKFWLVRRPDL